MRIVFLGSPNEVLAPLQKILQMAQSQTHGIELVGIVSQPARPVGRKAVLQDPPVAQFAKENNLPLLQPEKARDAEFLRALRAWQPDVCVTAAYGQILNEEFLSIPTRATINIHPSLLPRYRGATPVPAALLAGDEETGVTILFTIKQLDAGAIIAQKKFAILDGEGSGALTLRMFAESATMLPDAFAKLRDTTFSGIPQVDAQATFCKKIQKTDGAIDWHLDAGTIINRFRAFAPWPGSYTFMQGRRIAVLQATKSQRSAFANVGCLEFNKTERSIDVSCGGGGCVSILALQPAGSKPQDAAAFWNGLKDRSQLCFVGENENRE